MEDVEGYVKDIEYYLKKVGFYWGLCLVGILFNCTFLTDFFCF